MQYQKKTFRNGTRRVNYKMPHSKESPERYQPVLRLADQSRNRNIPPI